MNEVEAITTFAERMRPVMAAVMAAVTASIEAFGRSLLPVTRQWRLREARAALTRPDGRPRRTGHRHRGAWR